METIRQVALSAAFAGAQILRERLGRLSLIDYKGAFNLVTDADRASEREVIRVIRESYPDHQILGEETGSHASESSSRWIIDPLDGTTNYAHAYPFFAVSIGFEEKGQRMLGVVYNPVSEELFWAQRGGGAWLAEQQIRVSTVPTLADSLLATGFAPDTGKSRQPNFQEFCRLTDMCHGVRRDGAATLDLCFVACGRLDGFWEFKLAPWDLAAGTLIVEEAGGKVTGMNGAELDMNVGHVIATNGLIHDQVASELANLAREKARSG